MRTTCGRLTADQYDSAHDSFPTHFDINYLPQKPSPHGRHLGGSENSGGNAHDGEGRATFVAQFLGNRLGDSKALRTPELCQSAKW